MPKAWNCRALELGGTAVKRVLEDRRCRPKAFLLSYVRRRLFRRSGSYTQEVIEDIVQDTLLGLIEKPLAGTISPPSLHGLRRVLAARAGQAQADRLRTRLGRIRCGNCLYHHRELPSGHRICHHPDPDHPWHAERVEASSDPRGFEPPCFDFMSHRETRSLPGGESEDRVPTSRRALRRPTGTVAPGGGGTDKEPGAKILETEVRALVPECLAAAQRQDPRAVLAAERFYMRKWHNRRIAEDLGVTVRQVNRLKDRGLKLIQAELAQRGIVAKKDVSWE